METKLSNIHKELLSFSAKSKSLNERVKRNREKPTQGGEQKLANRSDVIKGRALKRLKSIAYAPSNEIVTCVIDRISENYVKTYRKELFLNFSVLKPAKNGTELQARVKKNADYYRFYHSRIAVSYKRNVPVSLFSVLGYSQERNAVLGEERSFNPNSEIAYKDSKHSKKALISYQYLLFSLDEANDDIRSTIEEAMVSGDIAIEPYNPLELDDPELRSGKHRTVMNLPSLMTTIIPFTKPDTIKREINEQFKLKHPNIPLTLSMIRKAKAKMMEAATSIEDSTALELATVALAQVTFEKLVLKKKSYETEPQTYSCSLCCFGCKI